MGLESLPDPGRASATGQPTPQRSRCSLRVYETIADHYAELLAVARSHRRSRKATDLVIIATASATGRTLLTFDDAQATLAGTAGVAVNP